MNSVLVLEGTERAAIPMVERPQGDIRSVDAGYFRTLEIPLLRGQLFQETETRPVAVVSAVTANRAWWDANVHSTDETEARRQEAELRLREALGDPARFAAVDEALAGGGLNAIQRRQLERLRSELLPNQLDDALRRRLVELEARVESVFNTHRGTIDGERVDDNQIAEILLRSMLAGPPAQQRT